MTVFKVILQAFPGKRKIPKMRPLILPKRGTSDSDKNRSWFCYSNRTDSWGILIEPIKMQKKLTMNYLKFTNVDAKHPLMQLLSSRALNVRSVEWYYTLVGLFNSTGGAGRDRRLQSSKATVPERIFKKAAMTDSSASSDRRRSVFTVHQRSRRSRRFRALLLKDCEFVTTVKGGSLCSVKFFLKLISKSWCWAFNINSITLQI